LRRYLDCRFPRPVRIGRAVRRVRTRDLEAWLG
jgi:predicted DNA-binding transcriptional regulator AlpA